MLLGGLAVAAILQFDILSFPDFLIHCAVLLNIKLETKAGSALAAGHYKGGRKTLSLSRHVC